MSSEGRKYGLLKIGCCVNYGLTILVIKGKVLQYVLTEPAPRPFLSLSCNVCLSLKSGGWSVNLYFSFIPYDLF